MNRRRILSSSRFTATDDPALDIDDFASSRESQSHNVELSAYPIKTIVLIPAGLFFFCGKALDASSTDARTLTKTCSTKLL